MNTPLFIDASRARELLDLLERVRKLLRHVRRTTTKAERPSAVQVDRDVFAALQLVEEAQRKMAAS